MPGAAAVSIATVASGAMASRASSRAADRSAQAIENSSAEATQLQREALQYTSGVSIPQMRAGAEAQARQMLMSGIPAAQVKEFLRSTYAIRPFGAPGGAGGAPAGGPDYGAYVRDNPDLAAAFGAGTLAPGQTDMAAAGRYHYTTHGAREGRAMPTVSANAAAPNAAGGGEDSLAWIDEFDPQSFLQATPGYQFRLNEGQKAIERSAASRGKFFSGQLGKELTRYGQGVAADYWNDLWNEYGVLSGTGQTAGRSLSGDVSGFADRAGANAMAAGRARASAYQQQGEANANFWGDTVPGAIGWGFDYGAERGYW